MKKIILFTIIAVFALTTGYSQSALWTKAVQSRLNPADILDRTSVPKAYQLYTLDLAGLKSVLKTAPSRDSGKMSEVIVPFPDASGQLQHYRIYEASVMEPELAAKNPEIQSYTGQGIDDPTASIHLTTTLYGLHTMTLSGNGTYYIDPYTRDLKNYIVYNKSSLTTDKAFACMTKAITAAAMPESTNTIMASDGKFRTYRLAMACTVEYAAFHIAEAGLGAGTPAQKTAAVLAAMNVTVARVNSVYERDMSLRMVLVANNTNLIFVDTDTFSNNNPNALIGQGQTQITNIIGNANFDIGHTVSTGGGGLAGAGVCVNGQKASGVTGTDAPVGDPYDIDFVAHEMGHQFGANHTFSGEGTNCISTGVDKTRWDLTAVEPGSGTTIMAYAGICAPVDVQLHSDDYFHAVSIGEIASYISSHTCQPGTSNGNTPPSVAVLTNYAIPKGTPFVLSGSATDADGDALTYCWEQTNPGATTALPSASSTASNPNFRSLSPTASPKRYFPSLQTVLGGSLATTWEVIPNVARTMAFALTVRDNRTPNGGQTSRQNMVLTVNGTAGPFTVTSQNTDNIAWEKNSTQTVTWNVAGTTAAPINTSNVNILLSTDNGLTYPTVLAANVANDGSQDITVPNIEAGFCRIMVQPVNNVFYAINSKAFSIGVTVTTICNTYTNSTPTAIADGAGANTPGAVTSSTITVPASENTAGISDIDVKVNVTHSYISDLVCAIAHPDNTEVFLFGRPCDDENGINATFSDGAPALACATTITGTYSPYEPLAAFTDKPASGTYTLYFQDYYNQDTGTLNSWSVTICSNTLTPLNTQDFGLQDFALFPNPNKGNFNVQFSSSSSNEIRVNVSDMSGRQIFQKAYQNTGLFSQNFELGNIQSGIYLVTVQDGNKKEVKKIVVE